MTVAKTIKKQIENYYVGGHINYVELVELLEKNYVAPGVPCENNVSCPITENRICGILKSKSDVYPAIFTYGDKSMLIVSGYDITTGVED